MISIHVWCDLCGALPGQPCRSVGAKAPPALASDFAAGRKVHGRRALRAERRGESPEHGGDVREVQP